MGMMEDLAKLGKEIEAAKKNVSTLEGRLSEVVERNQTEFSVNSIEEAEKLLETYNKDIEKMDKTIEADFLKLKENFSW